jgi:ketosteroid isomerase-like protein
MKNTFFTLLLLALSLCSATAQTISAADQKGIDEMYTLLTAAFEKSDATLLVPVLADNVEQIIPTGEIVRGRNNVIAGMGGYMAFLKTQPKPDRVVPKLTAQQYRYLATDLVLTTYQDETARYYGDKMEKENMATSVLMRKVNGKWVAELITLTAMGAMPAGGK